MPILNKIHHYIDFHGKASRTEFVLIFFCFYAYLATFIYLDAHEIAFDLGALGFFGFVTAHALALLVFTSAVCRRHSSAGLPEHYLALWLVCQIAIALLGKFGGLAQYIVIACLLYLLGYHLTLCALPPKRMDVQA